MPGGPHDSEQPDSDKDLKANGLEGVAYAAHLLLKLKTSSPPPGDKMPAGHHYDNALQTDSSMVKKRGLPYARDDQMPAPAYQTQSAATLHGSNGTFYISGPRPARLFATQIHEFRKGKYATTGGDRGFMTVFEYDVRGHTMMIDCDTSFIRFTSITQALGKNKVNFGRLVRTCPALDPHITKLKGGYLSIQGTWLPYDLAKELSRRIAWEIRDHLVPLFGYDFPATCLRPDSEGFGQLAIGMTQKRARKRHNNGGPHQTSCYGPSTPIA
uniref:HTH APSES-type domain-containing protein n=1 Tax=Kalmanozyma brasiliensis (strain GHG001) TaxID=1365824 RepID=V5ETP8_KALBG